MLCLWNCFFASTLLMFLTLYTSDASLCNYTCLSDSVGSCFCVVNATSSSMLWSQAKSACEADGGYLARIDNVQQEILVENLTNSYMVTGTGTYLFSTCTGKSVYIGLRRINCTGSVPMFQWNDNCLNLKLNMTQVSLPSYNMGSFTGSSYPPPFGFGTTIPGGVCSDQAHLIVTCSIWGPWQDYPTNSPFVMTNYGFACRKDTNPCGSSPCMNGGICTNSLSCFNCACPCGFSGMQCEIATSCVINTTASSATTYISTSLVSTSPTTTNFPTTTSTISTFPTTDTSNWPTTTAISTFSTVSITNLPMTKAITSTDSSSTTTSLIATSVATYTPMAATSGKTTVQPSISNDNTTTAATIPLATDGISDTSTANNHISLNTGKSSKWLVIVLVGLVSAITTVTVVLCCILLSRYKQHSQSKNSISVQT